MPKSILGEQNRRNAALVDYINSRIGLGQRHRSLPKLAEALKIPVSTFRDRYSHPEKFRYEDMCELFRVTRATDQEIARIFGRDR